MNEAINPETKAQPHRPSRGPKGGTRKAIIFYPETYPENYPELTPETTPNFTLIPTPKSSCNGILLRLKRNGLDANRVPNTPKGREKNEYDVGVRTLANISEGHLKC